jgi:hypothetical protein
MVFYLNVHRQCHHTKSMALKTIRSSTYMEAVYTSASRNGGVEISHDQASAVESPDDATSWHAIIADNVQTWVFERPFFYI